VRKAHRAADLVSALRNPALLHASPRETSSVCLPIPDRLLDANDLEVLEPLPGAHTYCAFVAWLALYGSDAELAGAFLINFPAWGANCGRMRKALHEKYDVAQSALAFFGLFANMPSFEQEALGIIQNGLDRGVPARLIHRAAGMLQSYELMYWDAMAGAAGVPLDPGE
jgi:hypothetical protein